MYEPLQLSEYLGIPLDQIIHVSGEGGILHHAFRDEGNDTSSVDAFDHDVTDSRGISSTNGSTTLTSTVSSLSSATPEEDQFARRNGNWHLYTHYIQSIGWWQVAIFLGFSALNVFLIQFPGLYPVYSISGDIAF